VRIDDVLPQIKLADAAIEMGAVHKLDLTSDVTHLIVGNIATAKYRYVAKERPDIKVLKQEWVEAVRVSWMEGGDVDVAALQEEFTLPTFFGLQICITGFEEAGQRKYITDTAEEKGAIYHGDLTKVVTHLIAAVPEGKKYNAARSWGLTVVSLKWFEDSVERGMTLEEKLYDPLLPSEEQGKNAFRRPPEHRKITVKRSREGEGEAAPEVAKKKLRRSASTRMDSQSQDMWQDISAHSVNVDNTEIDQWNDRDDRATTLSKEASTNRRTASGLPLAPSEGPQGIFAGIYVLLHGFDSARKDRLQQFLEPNGAQIVQSTSELEKASRHAFFRERYLLVPHAAPTVKLELPEVPHGTVLATEWWIERSVHYQRYLNPATDVLSRPLWLIHAAGFDNTLISATGLDTVELRQAAEAVTMMGARYQQTLLPSSSVLICGSQTVKKEKGYYAQKHRIPIVSAEWLWECLSTGKKVPLDKYCIKLPTYDPRDFGDEESTGSPASTDMQQQGEKHAAKRFVNKV
jgi:NAD-dependent DNA ligase